MYDDEFELTFDLSDEDKASRAPEPEQEPVQEAAPEPAAETEPPVEAVPEPAVPAANGRCVLISGGDRGIGAAAARAFWQAGYRVAVLYHTHAEAAAALEKELPGLLAVQCDVASRASCEVAFHTVEQAVGHVDVLVSNAGIAQQKLFTDITPEEWQHMLDVNLSGAFHLCQLALPGMIRRKAGRILTVSSMWGPDRRQLRGALLRCQGGPDRPDQGPCQRGGAQRHHRELRGSGCHRHRYDGCLYGRG